MKKNETSCCNPAGQRAGSGDADRLRRGGTAVFGPACRKPDDRKLNKAYDTTYQNDADLKNKVGAMLNQIDENGEIDIASLNKSKIYGLPCDVVDNKDGTGTFTVYVIAQGINADKTKYKAIEVTEELLSKANANNADKVSSQKPEAVGAASIVKNGKTYVGVAYRMTVKVNFNA